MLIVKDYQPNNYYYRFCIGDEDSAVETELVKGALPIEEVFKTQMDFERKYFKIWLICNEDTRIYQSSEVAETILYDLGIDLLQFATDYDLNSGDPEENYYEFYDSSSIAKLWITILNKHNSKLKLEYVEDKEIPYYNKWSPHKPKEYDSMFNPGAGIHEHY